MTCKVCGSSTKKIQIGTYPITGNKADTIEASMSEKRIPFNMQICPSCKLSYYEYLPDADEILDQLYSQHLSTYYHTKQLSDYLNTFVNKLITDLELNSNDSILEIGCNDGRLLQEFQSKTKCRAYGIEPSNQFAESWQNKEIEVVNDYFSEKTVNKLKQTEYRLIYFRHVLEHINELIGFIKSVSELCTDKTILVIEVPYFISVLNRRRIDNISYSHLNYFTVSAMNSIISKFNLGITNVDLVETDGGSVVFHISKNIKTNNTLLDNYSILQVDEFIGSIKTYKEKCKNTLSGYKKGEVFGYGAGAKGQQLIHFLGLEEYIDTVIDDTPEFENKYIPGTKINIIPYKDIKNTSCKMIINLAPTHTEAIRSKIGSEYKFIDIINDDE